MKKVVINSKVGGFSVNNDIIIRLAELGCSAAKEEYEFMLRMADEGGEWNHYPLFKVDRSDSLLIQAIEEHLDTVPNLKIIEIPDDVKFYIFQNEMGEERVHEEHRVWS